MEQQMNQPIELLPITKEMLKGYQALSHLPPDDIQRGLYVAECLGFEQAWNAPNANRERLEIQLKLCMLKFEYFSPMADWVEQTILGLTLKSHDVTEAWIQKIRSGRER
jgi:hypothetical protein